MEAGGNRPAALGRGGTPDRGDREPDHPQPRDHVLLLAPLPPPSLRTAAAGRTGAATPPGRRDRPGGRFEARICSRPRAARWASLAVPSARDDVAPSAAAWPLPAQHANRAVTDELHRPLNPFERASECVAHGNRKVFEEIGREFARYLEECPPDETPDPRRFECVHPAAAARRPARRAALPAPGVRPLRAGPARARPEGPGGACCPREPRDRLPRADPAPARDPGRARCRLHDDGGPGASRARRAVAIRGTVAVRRPTTGLGPHRRRAYASSVKQGRIAREVITDSFMVLSLPGRVLALGTHLTDVYPDELRGPTDNDLVELLARYRARSAGTRRLRSTRVVGAAAADALHRPPVLRVPPAARALRQPSPPAGGGFLRPWRGPEGRL